MAALGYGCEFGDCPAQPVHLLTDTRNGATVSLCDEHYAPGIIPLLAAALGVDPMEFYAHIEKYLTAQAKKAERELAKAQAAQAVKSSDAPAVSPDDASDDDTETQRLPGGLLAGPDTHAEVP